MEFQMPTIIKPVFPDRKMDIRDFGAVADGITMNTDAINNAITACSEAGGGTVLIPAGFWKTATIHLKNGVRLDTAAGAFIKFSNDYRDYPLIPSITRDSPPYAASPPSTPRMLRISPSPGDGIFDGAGEVWRVCKKMEIYRPSVGGFGPKRGRLSGGKGRGKLDLSLRGHRSGQRIQQSAWRLW